MTKLMPKHINGIELPKQLRDFANQALKDHNIRKLAVALLATVKGAMSQSSSQVTNTLQGLLETTANESKAVSHSVTALIDRAIERLTQFTAHETAEPDTAKKKKKTKSAKAKPSATKTKIKKSAKPTSKPKPKSKAKQKEQPANK